MEQWSNQGELTETITAVTSLITQSYQYREVILTIKRVWTMSLGKCCWLAAGATDIITLREEREQILNIFILGVGTIEAPANLMETPFQLATLAIS